MALYAISDTSLNALADAVRSKTGVDTQMSLEEIIAAIHAVVVHTNGDLDGMIARTLEVVESDTVQSIAAYAFYNNPVVRTVVAAAAKSIGEYAFCDCINLERVSCSAASIGDYAFLGCNMLNEILFDRKILDIGAGAFAECSSLESVDLRDTYLPIIMPNTFADSGIRELKLPDRRFVSLPSTSAFAGSPLGVDGNGGVIYLPLEYRVSYEANTVWSAILGNNKNIVISYE
ncbi:MAG: leucine-rich repeat domain-containing protein [Clostridia bacterium]|nr:leucine-rich repeat domain-containing protein [Clostridia bacterium]